MQEQDPAPTVCPTIAEGDTMFQPSDPNRYFMMGTNAVEGIERTRAAANASQPARILDLGCGYGRVLRALAAAFPDAHLAASDVEQPALAFCADTFDVEPIPGVRDLREFPFNQPYDVIWSGSLVTHLDLHGWAAYFDLLARALTAGGVAVFSTHGKFVADRMRSDNPAYDYGLSARQRDLLLQSYDDSGFGYQDYKPDSMYGISLSQPSWVLRQLEPTRLRVAHLHEQGWGAHQDLIGLSTR
jgi:SAM-dependent methyltransferase